VRLLLSLVLLCCIWISRPTSFVLLRFFFNSQLCYPPKNRKLRDELSHNLFLMIQECNKFREHQAREILISTLQQQLERREEGLAVLKGQIREAEEALVALNKFREG
jgi:hypothetical protein